MIECDEGLVPFRGTFELEPHPQGTRLSWIVETGGLAMRLAGPLAARVTRDELAADLVRLKRLLDLQEDGAS